MSQDPKSQMSRRQVLVSLGAVASVAAIGGIAGFGSNEPGVALDHAQPDNGEGKPLETASATPSPFGKALPHGAKLGAWQIERVLPVTLGAIPVVMRGQGGERFQVDILARDYAEGSASGVANTSKMSLFVANNGSGACATCEDHGLGAMMLGRYLALCETRGLRVPRLMTHATRNARYPRGNFTA
ncbi:MAG: hypothetical protein ACPG4T_01410 [Nannocystaceae bacterium]